MATDRYEIYAEATDVWAGLIADARQAKRDEMLSVADRQNALAMHMQNAEHHMRKHAPSGCRLQLKLVYEWVLDVNPVLKPEFRK